MKECQSKGGDKKMKLPELPNGRCGIYRTPHQLKEGRLVGGLGGRCLKFEMSGVQMESSARQMGIEI